MKGITPVVAIVLLMILLVVIASLMFVFLARFQGSSQNAAQNQTETLIGGYNPVSVDNLVDGQLNLRSYSARTIPNNSIALYISDQRVEATSQDIQPGGLATLYLGEGILPAGTYKVKVTAGATQDLETIAVEPRNNLREPDFDGPSRLPIAAVIAVDTSTAANSYDLAAAQSVIGGFAQALLGGAGSNNTIALVKYSDSATVLQEPTSNLNIFDGSLSLLTQSGSGERAIGSAIGNSSALLAGEPPGTRKIMVVIAGGDENMGTDPVGNAVQALNSGITIYSVAYSLESPIGALDAISNLTDGTTHSLLVASDINAVLGQILYDSSAFWHTKGALSAINASGPNCYSQVHCAALNFGVYPNSAVYQDLTLLFSGQYNVIVASAQIHPNGPVCVNQCARLPGQTCAKNDARVHIITYNSTGGVLGEFTGPWAGAMGSGWVKVNSVWATPPSTKRMRFQIDAGDCCASCSANGVYIDDTNMVLAKP